MRVSVIIPAHNYGRFLVEAVDSVRAQTVDDLEILVVDDGSTDETPAVTARFTDPRIRTIRIPESGVSVARNTGLDLARGEFVAFLDADDRWLPAKLERQLEVLSAEPGVGMVFTNFRRFDGRGPFPTTQFDLIPELDTIPTRPSAAGQARVLVGNAFADLVMATQFPTWVQTVLLRRQAIHDLRFPPGVRLSQDMHYMYRAYPRVGAAFLRESLVEVRRHGRNSYTNALQKLEAEPRVLRMLLAEPFGPGEHAVLRRKTGRAWCSLGWYHFHHGAPTRALAPYFRALAYPGCRWAAIKHLVALPASPFVARRAKGATATADTW